MHALEKEYAVVNKMYTIARDFDVSIDPEDLALYQTLSPSFQHLKVEYVVILLKRLSRPQTSLWSFLQQVRSEQGQDEAFGRGFSRSKLSCC